MYTIKYRGIKQEKSFKCADYSGWMLIELLIMLAIGLLIISILFAIYLSSMHSYRLQNALNQLQENAQTASHILTTEIHRAGYIGCARLTEDFPLIFYPPFTLTPQNKITSSPHNEMMVRHMSLPAAVLMEPLRNASSLQVSNHVHFTSGEILMISDCKKAEVFAVKEVEVVRGMQVIYPVRPLQYHYEKQAEVSQLSINTYFIANTKRTYLDGTPLYALFVRDNNQRKFELVEGIQQMTIRYTVKQDGNLIELPAEQIAKGSTLVGVAIDLNLISPPVNKIWHLYAAVSGQSA